MSTFEHDSDLDQLDDLDSGLKARVVIDGWDKLIARPGKKDLYDLRSDPDDRNDLTMKDKEKVAKLSGLIDEWLVPAQPGVGSQQ